MLTKLRSHKLQLHCFDKEPQIGALRMRVGRVMAKIICLMERKPNAPLQSFFPATEVFAMLEIEGHEALCRSSELTDHQ